MEQKWAQSGVEPPLSELMSEPIVHLLMLRDNITSEDVWSAIGVYWKLQRQVQAHHPVVIDNMAANQTLPSCPAPPSPRVCAEKNDVMSGPSLNRAGGGAAATYQKNTLGYDKKGTTLCVGVRRSTSS